MRYYRFTCAFDGRAVDREDAIHRLQQLFGDLPVENLSLDVAELPMTPQEIDREEAKRQIESDTDGSFNLAEHLSGGSPQVKHPWEMGLFLFPDDHPLARVERAAYEQWTRGPSRPLERGEIATRKELEDGEEHRNA